MLVIPREILEAVVEQARAGLPQEVCGILGGSGNAVCSLHPMTNVEGRSDHFAMDPEEQFAVARSLRSRGEKMLAIYHSHPESPPFPSQEDIRLAHTPNVYHLIASLENPDHPVAKAFRICEGVVEPVQVVIRG